MKRVKVGIALISMFGILLGTSGIALAKSTPVHHPKVSQSSTKLTHHSTKSQITKLTLHKLAKTTKLTKTVKTAKHIKD